MSTSQHFGPPPPSLAMWLPKTTAQAANNTKRVSHQYWTQYPTNARTRTRAGAGRSAFVASRFSRATSALASAALAHWRAIPVALSKIDHR